MKKMAHLTFPFVTICLVASAGGTKFIIEYLSPTASWLGFLPKEIWVHPLALLGAYLPDALDRFITGHNRTTSLQHQKDNGEWLTDLAFYELKCGHEKWWKFHRTITHWWPIPVVLYFVGLQPLAFGWATHLLLDTMTPMGIPMLAPFPSDKESGYMRIPKIYGVRGFEFYLTITLAWVALYYSFFQYFI